MKLYPPYIEGIIPSFSLKSGTGTVITVPFSMNRAVGQTEISNFSLKVKNIISNEYILTLTADSYNYERNEVYFVLLPTQAAVFNIGQHYKIQLAYIDITGEIGYYSTVGVIKCTDEVSAKIEGLSVTQSNIHRYTYKGIYNHKDSTEKEYQYQFIITDVYGNIIKDSGKQIHYVELDEDMYSSSDSFEYYADLIENEKYYIQYNVITNNQLMVKSKKYCIMQSELVEMEEPLTLTAELNYDNGYIQVDIKQIGKEEEEASGEFFAEGNFLISRACSDTQYTEWEPIRTIKLNGKGPIYSSKKDFTIEQGKTYKYALQKYNTYNLLTQKRCSNTVFADFEDAFLSDGQYQLRIRYNPQINSFKTTLQETKVETIGGKYPIFFKNGNVEYKEFPISGLVSYKMDEADTFVIDKNELGFDYEYTLLDRHTNNTAARVEELEDRRRELYDILYKNEAKRKSYSDVELQAFTVELKNIYRMKARLADGINRYDKEIINTDQHATTDLIGTNFAAERIFKIKVLDWLNNGQPKIFRSPSEGNYIVRLLNTSLSPEARLGRLLHNFSTTAYEMAEFNYDNLKKYHLINVDEINFLFLLWKTVLLSEPQYNTRTEKEVEEWDYYFDAPDEDVEVVDNNEHKVIYRSGEILPPGIIAQSVYLYDFIPGTTITIDGVDIVVGANGSHYFESQNGIKSIVIPHNNYYTGSITYSYYGVSKSNFDLILDEGIETHACRQFIGDQSNIIKQIEDVKTSIINFYKLSFMKREIIDVKYESNYNTYYSDKECTKKIYLKDDLNFNTQSDYYVQIDDPVGAYQPYTKTSYDETVKYFTIDEEGQYNEISFVDELPTPYYTKKNIVFLIDDHDTMTSKINNIRPLYRYNVNNIIIDGKYYYFNNYFANYNRFYFYTNDDYSKQIFNEKTLYIYDSINDRYVLATGEFDINEEYYEKIPVETITLYQDFQNNHTYANKDDYNKIKVEIFDKIYKTDNTYDNIYTKMLNNYIKEYYNYTGNKKRYFPLNEESIDIILTGKTYTITKDELIYYYFMQPLSYNIVINDEVIDLTDEQHYDIIGEDNYSNIELSNGTLLDCTYKTKVLTYSLEENSDDFIFNNYKAKLLDCLAKINHTDESSYINIDDLNEVLKWYKAELVRLLLNADSTEVDETDPNQVTFDYDGLVDEYIAYLNLYESCMLGELAIEDVDIAKYPRLQEKFNDVLEIYEEARTSYYSIYNNYIKRLEYLLDKYRKGESA